jgi:hypothetical protein
MASLIPTYADSAQTTIVALGGTAVSPPGATLQATLAALAMAPKASETKTSGALSVDPGTPYSLVSVTGTVAFTLADGVIEGQVKEIECTVAATTPLGTLTITTPFTSQSSTHVFTAVGQKLTLVWRTLGWAMIDKKRAGSQAVVVGTTVLTGYDMASTYALSVTGTVSSTTTKGLPNGTVPGERMKITTPTAASSPVGDIAVTAVTIATNAAATSLAGINATTAQAGFTWNGAAWQCDSLTTATLS